MAQSRFSLFHRIIHFQSEAMLAASLLLPLLFSSCMTEKRASVVQAEIERKTQQIAKLERDNSQLANELSGQKKLSQKLQTALLMRHKETDACRRINEKLVKELLQSRAKLVNRGSKLEAATLIAEATAVIGSVAKQALDDRQKILLKKANQNLTESKRELEKENYEGASLFCRKAMERVKRISIDKDTPRTDEIFFSTPLPMELFKTGNLRSFPSTKADIKRVLTAGSRVIAIGFQRNWVKVKSPDPLATGWIHLSLFY